MLGVVSRITVDRYLILNARPLCNLRDGQDFLSDNLGSGVILPVHCVKGPITVQKKDMCGNTPDVSFGSEAAIRWLLIFRLAKRPERVAYLPCPEAGILS